MCWLGLPNHWLVVAAKTAEIHGHHQSRWMDGDQDTVENVENRDGGRPVPGIRRYGQYMYIHVLYQSCTGSGVQHE